VARTPRIYQQPDIGAIKAGTLAATHTVRVDLLFELGDQALAASERLSASVRFRAVTGRPSRQLPRLGCADFVL
jgi:hypothetical protein